MKFIYGCILCLCLVTTSYGGTTYKHTNTWVINEPAIESVHKLKEKFATRDGPSMTFPDEVRPYIPKLFIIDLDFTFSARPYHHYYKFQVELKKPFGKLWNLNKELEIWAQKEQTVYRSTVTIGYGRDLKCKLLKKVKSKIVHELVSKFLMMEEQKIRQIIN